MKNMGLTILLKMLPLIIDNLTPAIKDGLEKLLSDLHDKAIKTSNPWDDMAIEFLGAMLNVELEVG